MISYDEMYRPAGYGPWVKGGARRDTKPCAVPAPVSVDARQKRLLDEARAAAERSRMAAEAARASAIAATAQAKKAAAVCGCGTVEALTDAEIDAALAEAGIE